MYEDLQANKSRKGGYKKLSKSTNQNPKRQTFTELSSDSDAETPVLKPQKTSILNTSEDLLSQAKIEVKELHYQLRRVVKTDEDSHIVLPQDTPTHQDILKQTHMFFKVCVRGEASQGRILIQYDAGQSPPILDSKGRQKNLKSQVVDF